MSRRGNWAKENKGRGDRGNRVGKKFGGPRNPSNQGLRRLSSKATY
jgi:hypothetical protein